MMTDDPDDTDDLELRRWREDGKAPAGSCPYCASRISMVERDGFFRARCSHRGCGATGPKMRSITRAADLFCCPPQRTAGGMAVDDVSAELDTPRDATAAAARWRKVAPLIERLADDVRRRELIARAEFDRRVSDTVTDLLAATRETTP